MGSDGMKCPKCGCQDLYAGFGLAGGGYGAYEMCDGCGYFLKDYIERTTTEDAAWCLAVAFAKLGGRDVNRS